MTQETQEQVEQTPEQATAEFEAGFNSIRSDDVTPPEPKEVAAETSVTDTEVSDDGKKAEAEAEPEEPTFLGMTESQIKSLLERATRIDALEQQLQKAHGKIGELNRTVTEYSSRNQKPTQQQAAPANDENAGEVGQWEQDFPEFAALAEAKARKIAAEMMQGQQPSQQQAIDADAIKDQIVRETNIAIMDANYDGWRDTVASQDFSLWIATQPAEVQETFNNTVSAKALGSILSSFDNWKNKVGDRSAKNKARLEQALIPTGNGSKVTHAPTAHDEFVAGFNAIRASY